MTKHPVLDGYILFDEKGRLVLEINQFRSDGSATKIIFNSDGTIQHEHNIYEKGYFKETQWIRIDNMYEFLSKRLIK